jgi:hypothetical protein
MPQGQSHGLRSVFWELRKIYLRFQVATITKINMNKILNPLVKPLLPICFKFFPASKCIKTYKHVFGRLPNVIKPKTFNEKILRKMLFDRNPRLTLFADKFLVRDFVKSRLGDDKYLTELYGVVDSPAKIRDLNLPDRFVMKPNHLCNTIKIVRDF